MNAQFFVGGAQLWQVAGWTMVHFLWLGALAALLALVCRVALRRAPANVRYGAMLAWLVLLALLPAGIAAWVAADEELNESQTADVVASDGFESRSLLDEGDGGRAPFEIIELNGPEAEATVELNPLSADYAGGVAGEINGDVDGVARPELPVMGVVESEPASESGATGSASASSASGIGTGAGSTPAEPLPGPFRKGTGALIVLKAWVPYLPWVWIVGTPLTLALLVTGVIGAKRLERASRVIETGPVVEALARLKASLRVSRRVAVAVCERIAAPVLVGIVRPMILLPPSALTGWSPDEIEMVLLHELAHVRRWDNCINLLQRLVESLLFFHPAVWLVSTWVRREREACCDAVVVRHTERPQAYAEMLVSFASQISEPGRPRPRSLRRPGSLVVGSAMAAGPLRGRIRRILQLEDDPMLVSGKSLVVVMGALVVAATLGVLYLPTRGQAEESAAGEVIVEELNTEIAEGAESTEEREDVVIVEEERELSDRGKKEFVRESLSAKNLKKLMLAMHMYHDAKKQFPAHASYDGAGKPLLSWRVHLLPFLGEEKLYQEFHLDEAWDSPHNLELMKQMPDVFKNPDIELAEGETDYVAVVDEDCVIDGSPKGISIRQIPDGTSKTIVLVEANADQGVEWTRPEDLQYDAERANYGLGSVRPEGWLAAWADGYVSLVANGVEAEQLRSDFERSDQARANRAKAAGDPAMEMDPTSEGSVIDPTAYGDPAMAEIGMEGGQLPGGEYGAEPGLSDETPASPAEADDEAWLAALGELSDKDRAIAERASKELGLKLAAASDADLENVRKNGRRGGLRLFEFDHFPQQYEGPFILTQIQSKALARGIVTFSDLEKILDSMESLPSGSPVVLYGIAKGGIFNYSMKLPQDSTTGSVTSSRFPSLEEQKLADLAWKRLGLELEQIDAEDLAKVKALGFAGGVMVTEFRGAADRRWRDNEIQAGDLLVGLHVWPTASLQDVAAVLERDDVMELSPLKFYVVRRGDLTENSTLPKVDTVITGRIEVLAPSNPFGANSRARAPAGAMPTERVRPGTAPTPSVAAAPSAPSWPSTRSVQPTVPATAADPWAQVPAQTQVWSSQPPAAPTPAHSGPWPQAGTAPPNEPTLAMEPTMPVPPAEPTNSAPVLDPAPTEDRFAPQPTIHPSPAQDDDSERSPMPGAPQVFDPPQLFNPRDHGAKRVATADKSNLRYDGKSFEEWARLWRTELSNDKRAEAVKALAAFARAGYGKEAVEVILDVAGEYDFYILHGTNVPEGRLQEAVLDVLAPSYPGRSLAEIWLPELARRLKAEPEKWKWLVAHLLGRVTAQDEATIAALQTLAAEGPKEIQVEALGALVRSARSRPELKGRLDEKTRELLGAVLEGDDSSRVNYALRLLLEGGPHGMSGGMGGRMVSTPTSRLIFVPELVPLLFHADENVQRQARRVLRYISEKDAPQVVEQLVGVLADESRSADHIAAVRGLAAMGGQAKEAIPALQEMLKESGDKGVLLAAIVAWQNIVARDSALDQIIDFQINGPYVLRFEAFSDEEKRSLEKRIGVLGRGLLDASKNEAKAILPPAEPGPGVGGGMF